MHLDVTELRAFYQTPLGRIARQIVSAEIRSVWPSAAGDRVVGIGHPLPYLRPYMQDAERVVALMPAASGVVHWPREGPNLTALTFEDELPLPDSSVDKLLLIHLLESARDPFAVLREAWRVLMPKGRILVIVPYRTGAWARADHTPMGLGRPFSRFQLSHLLESAWLEPTQVRHVLYVPPSRRRFILGSAGAWERVGRRVAPRLAGLLAIEAEKTVVRGLTVHKPARGIRIFVPGLAPAPKPAAMEGNARPVPRVANDARPPVSAATGTQPARRTGSRTTTAR
jgi:SAM-dependent methyltransferase